MQKFIKLIRPINLLIIAFTMFGLGWYFDTLLTTHGSSSQLFSLPFLILVISTIFIAAAGNIINDYFDVKADRINRPEKQIIGKHIKRRWAIVSHWVINFIAFAMALYLSYIFSTFWYLFIHLLSINLLWYYSMHLKRTAVLGNITIAILTGLVPVLVGIFYGQQMDWELTANYYPFQLSGVEYFPIYISVGLGLFGFFLNWAREIVKDIEDIEGDKALKAKTLPIVLGINKTKIVTYFILAAPALLSLFFFWGLEKDIIVTHLDFYPLILAGIAILIGFYFVIRAKLRNDFKRAHLIIKLVMIIGLLLPVYWTILIKYI